MKKMAPIVLVSILILSGLGAGAFAYGEDESNHVKMTLSLSNFCIRDEGEYINLELEGANSIFTKEGHYVIPTHIETFTFPLGTKIHNINVVPGDIHSQKLEKKLKIAPEPVLMYNPVTKQKNNIIKPQAIDHWYNYNIGMGIARD